MGPIARLEVVNFWPPSPARVQTVQELAHRPARNWPIAHFPFDFSRNPPYNPPYAPLRSSRSSPHAGHGVSYRSASRTPSHSRRAEASEAQPSRVERTQARRQAALTSPPQRTPDPLPGLLPPCPAGPSSARVGPSRTSAGRVCRGTPLSMRAAVCADARPLQVGSGATWRRAGRAAGGRGGVRSPGSGLAELRAPGRAEGASGGRCCAPDRPVGRLTCRCAPSRGPRGDPPGARACGDACRARLPPGFGARAAPALPRAVAAPGVA